MKHVKGFSLFESYSSGLSKEDIDFLNDVVVDGKWRVNKNTGLIDVAGSVYLKQWGSFNVSFGRIEEDFSYPNSFDYPNPINKQGLKGAPREVGHNFYYHGSEGHYDLIGGPEIVGGYYAVNSCGLTSLEGAPHEVRDFSCTLNKLKTLKGGPIKVGYNFECDNNPLTDLEGSPREIGNDFSCTGTKVISLKGAPEKIGGKFVISSIERKTSKWTGHKYNETIAIDWSMDGWIEGLKDIPYLFAPLVASSGGDIPSNILSVVRRDYPDIWPDIVSKLDQEGTEISADLGDLGF